MYIYIYTKVFHAYRHRNFLIKGPLGRGPGIFCSASSFFSSNDSILPCRERNEGLGEKRTRQRSRNKKITFCASLRNDGGI